MREIPKVNAMRSGVVVVGALAFGYLTLQLGFKPFLERAQETLDKSAHPSDESFDNAPSDESFASGPSDESFDNALRISEYSHTEVKDN